MKVRTNLSSKELEVVGKGLVKLALSQSDKSLSVENNAEQELLQRAVDVFDVMVDSLQKEVTRILLTDGEFGEA